MDKYISALKYALSKTGEWTINDMNKFLDGIYTVAMYDEDNVDTFDYIKIEKYGKMIINLMEKKNKEKERCN